MPYRSVTHIENAVQGAAGGPNAAFTTLIPLPEQSWEGRSMHAIRIGGGTGERIGVYLVGGLHAREWGSPDILTRLVEDLTQAYRTGHDMTFGSRTFTAAEVVRVVEGIDLFVFPQANPDGRQHSMANDIWWRKNRRPDPNPSNVGVDVNRNFDFCWHYPTYFSPSSGVVSSTTPSSEIYIGPSAESEPETRNIVSIVEGNPGIRFFVDVHSYSQLVLYGWGDDQMQSADPAQTFSNPAFNGQRGVANDAYGEYLPAADLALEEELGTKIRDGIVGAGGPAYTVEPSFGLYPTSGTSTERGMMRHFLDRAQGKVHGYTIEWGTQFQPPWSDMADIVEQVCSGLMEFLLGILAKHSDVFVRDNASDTGAPGSTNPFWESPDIVIRHTDDGVFAHEDPVMGQDNFLYVRVTNRGPNTSGELKVSARVAAFAGTEFLFPHDWTAQDATHLAGTPIADTFSGIAVGDSRIARFRLTAAQVATLGSWQANGWHPCLLAEVDCVTDFAASGGTRVWNNNNLGQRNISVMPAKAGMTIKWAFVFGHELDELDRVRLEIDLVDMPREPLVELDLLDVTDRFPALDEHVLVRDRTLLREKVAAAAGRRGEAGLHPDLADVVTKAHRAETVADRPVLRLTGQRSVLDLKRIPHRRNQALIRFTVPKDARPGEVYRLRVAQQDKRGRVVGGVTLEVPVVG